MPADTQRAWPYDLIGAVYDDDMGKNAPGHDVDFYVASALHAGHRTLELGCGTGRITLPLVRAGLDVTGVDRSLSMLEALQDKARRELSAEQRARLRVEHVDMRELALSGEFDSVLCPYSAFTYLVAADDRRRALDAVRRHLRPGGCFLLDVFIPDPSISAQPGDVVLLDYKRPRADGTFLERSRRIQKDVEPGINLIERHYRVLDAEDRELERFSTESRIHYWYPDELGRELEAHGFEIREASFDFGQPAERPKMLALRCRVR